MSARVADVMTTNVVAVRRYASFKEIAARLRDLRVSAFPVLDDDGAVLGVVSETDLIAKEARPAGDEGHPGPFRLRHRRELEKAAATTAADLMTEPPVTIGPYDLVSDAAHLMYDHKVSHLPVVGQHGELLGIISRADVLSVFGRPDKEIRHEIIETVIARHYFTDPGDFTVIVEDGVVTLKGRPENPDVGHGIVTEVRHLEGVVAVHDELAYPAPTWQRQWGEQASW